MERRGRSDAGDGGCGGADCFWSSYCEPRAGAIPRTLRRRAEPQPAARPRAAPPQRGQAQAHRLRATPPFHHAPPCRNRGTPTHLVCELIKRQPAPRLELLGREGRDPLRHQQAPVGSETLQHRLGKRQVGLAATRGPVQDALSAGSRRSQTARLEQRRSATHSSGGSQRGAGETLHAGGVDVRAASTYFRTWPSIFGRARNGGRGRRGYGGILFDDVARRAAELVARSRGAKGCLVPLRQPRLSRHGLPRRRGHQPDRRRRPAGADHPAVQAGGRDRLPALRADGARFSRPAACRRLRDGRLPLIRRHNGSPHGKGLPIAPSHPKWWLGALSLPMPSTPLPTYPGDIRPLADRLARAGSLCRRHLIRHWHGICFSSRVIFISGPRRCYSRRTSVTST